MFIGHFAVGFAAEKFAPRTSMAVLLAAPLFLDLLWPVFLLLGWEHVRIDPGNTRFTPLDWFDYPGRTVSRCPGYGPRPLPRSTT
jgi:hypothetical protein